MVAGAFDRRWTFVAFSGKGPIAHTYRSVSATLWENGGETTMPEFCSPFSGLASDRKLTKDELVRAVRFMVAAEYEAIQLYMQLAESTDNSLAIDVFTDIADEERIHAGEFLRLLKELAPDEERLYAEGEKEVEEEIAKKTRQP